MVLLHARFRAQRQQGRWQPYADAQVGFTDLFTTTTVEGAFDCTYIPGGISGSGYSSCNQAQIAEKTNARDFVLSYGGSGGVMMRFRSSQRSPKLDLAVRYHRGGDALYLTEGAIRLADDGLVLDFSRSRTDMVLVYIGIVVGR